VNAWKSGTASKNGDFVLWEGGLTQCTLGSRSRSAARVHT
jgi:hypothetical protein